MEETKQWIITHRLDEGLLTLIDNTNEIEGQDIRTSFRITFTNRQNGEIYVNDYSEDDVCKMTDGLLIDTSLFMEIVEEEPTLILTYEKIICKWSFKILKREFTITITLPRSTQPDGLIEAKLRTQIHRITTLEDKLRITEDKLEQVLNILLTDRLNIVNTTYDSKNANTRYNKLKQIETLVSLGAKCHNGVYEKVRHNGHDFTKPLINDSSYIWNLLTYKIDNTYNDNRNPNYILINTLEQLLKSGINPNMRNEGNSINNDECNINKEKINLDETLLHYYCAKMYNNNDNGKKGNRKTIIELIKMLLKYGADVTLKTKTNETALIWLEKIHHIRNATSDYIKDISEIKELLKKQFNDI